jgi:hypothetical protein
VRENESTTKNGNTRANDIHTYVFVPLSRRIPKIKAAKKKKKKRKEKKGDDESRNGKAGGENKAALTT